MLRMKQKRNDRVRVKEPNITVVASYRNDVDNDVCERDSIEGVCHFMRVRLWYCFLFIVSGDVEDRIPT